MYIGSSNSDLVYFSLSHFPLYDTKIFPRGLRTTCKNSRLIRNGRSRIVSIVRSELKWKRKNSILMLQGFTAIPPTFSRTFLILTYFILFALMHILLLKLFCYSQQNAIYFVLIYERLHFYLMRRRCSRCKYHENNIIATQR